MTAAAAGKGRAPRAAKASAEKAKPVMFTFGEPTPVLSRSDVLDYCESWSNGRWYEPPVSQAALTRTFKVAPHHSSAIMVKVNALASSFIPCPQLSRPDFKALVLDYIVTANGYLEEQRAISGRLLKLKRSPAKYTRRGLKDGIYFFLAAGDPEASWRGGIGGEHEFKPGAIKHIMQPDLHQELYGVPDYLSALQSAFLNEAATIFRRRYYENGSHAGFILYMTDAAHSEADVNGLRQALKESKGPGNFRNVFMYAPQGKKDGLQVIPISEVAAKDDFLNIKGTSRDDILAAHRVPPQLLGVVPANAGGFGDVAKAADVFHWNEIAPLQKDLLQINDVVGQEVVRFAPYEPMSVAPAGKAA